MTSTMLRRPDIADRLVEYARAAAVAVWGCNGPLPPAGDFDLTAMEGLSILLAVARGTFTHYGIPTRDQYLKETSQ